MEIQHVIFLDGNSLTIENVIDVAFNNVKVDFSLETKETIETQRESLEKQITKRPDIAIYGTNRLHGDLKDVPVELSDLLEYQVKYMMVHNCGTGKALDIEAVRAIMLIRLNSFARGMSGVSMSVCQLMIDMLNCGVTPWVLEEGSVGASGDLVPLAMVGATLIHELSEDAKAYYKGELLTAREALKKANLKPVKLGVKEAMALTNGSNFIAALATLALYRAENVLNNASITSALSLEAIRGEIKAFSKLINEDSNRHSGQVRIAREMRRLLRNSKRMSINSQKASFNDKGNCKERVQDRYSFRAIPQVHGASYEALEKLRASLETEINSTTDNPIFGFDQVDSKGEGILFASGANFHGQALATVIDYAKISLTSLALITDKRTFSLLDANLSYGLPSDLAYDTSKADGGLMITQYAGAARVAECRVLSSPASIMSVSTAANQEDFVSMGSIGVLHLQKIISNLEIVVAIELLCATRALQLTYDWLPTPLRELGEGTAKVFEYVSSTNQLPSGDDSHYLKDHYLRYDMEKAIAMVQSGELINQV